MIPAQVKPSSEVNVWGSLIQGKVRVRCIHADAREHPEIDLVVEIENQSYVLFVGIVEQAPYPVILGRAVPILVDL